MKPNRLIALAITAGIAAAALSAAGCSKTIPGTAASTAPNGTATHTTISAPSHQVSYSPQIVLPFRLINHLAGVAVDTAGNVYVADTGSKRVLKLATGASSPTVLPFNDLIQPDGVAVDIEGNLYVSDWGNNRVLKLAAGTSAPTVLPFTGLNEPGDVAVDTAGNVYLLDEGNFQVLKLPVH